jgi:hypothetical protein
MAGKSRAAVAPNVFALSACGISGISGIPVSFITIFAFPE